MTEKSPWNTLETIPDFEQHNTDDLFFFILIIFAEDVKYNLCIERPTYIAHFAKGS
jgi:hypothetical protein